MVPDGHSPALHHGLIHYTCAWAPSFYLEENIPGCPLTGFFLPLHGSKSCPMSIPRLVTACVCVCVLSCFSRVLLCATLWTVAHQTPLSMGILHARILGWVAISSSGDLSHPGIEPTSIASPALVGGFFTISAAWEALVKIIPLSICATWFFLFLID